MAYQAPAIQFRSSGGRIALNKHTVTQLNQLIHLVHKVDVVIYIRKGVISNYSGSW